MTIQPITISSWPRAIAHLDADAFFVSCEQAIHPELKGKPVITGKERGIVAALSYEAKAKGVQRGMRLFEVRKICPECIILPSDYETYSLFSKRMFDLLRRFSPDVEEYSIDEAFLDLTGLRRTYHGSYGSIAEQMQQTVVKELGITVSIGVSISKVLAKIGSKHTKPAGITLIRGRDIHLFLDNLSIEKVWGIGPNTSAYLRKFGIVTALDYARKDEAFIKRALSKPYQEIWHELNGRSVYPVTVQSKTSYQSISKARTFTPPSKDRDFVFAQLAKNLENACIKARRYNLAARRLVVFLRQQDFRDAGIEVKVSRPTAIPTDLFPSLREGMQKIFRGNTFYRQTGVVLCDLVPEEKNQYTLFDDTVQIEKMSKLYKAVDTLSERFGKHTLQSGASLPTKLQTQHEGDRGDVAVRKTTTMLKGENARQRLGMPVLHLKV